MNFAVKQKTFIILVWKKKICLLIIWLTVSYDGAQSPHEDSIINYDCEISCPSVWSSWSAFSRTVYLFLINEKEGRKSANTTSHHTACNVDAFGLLDLQWGGHLSIKLILNTFSKTFYRLKPVSNLINAKRELAKSFSFRNSLRPNIPLKLDLKPILN